MYVKLGHAKFQPSSAWETFSNWGLNGWGGVEYSMEYWSYLGNGER